MFVVGKDTSDDASKHSPTFVDIIKAVQKGS